MADLNAAKRAKMPKKDFAIPSKKAFPLNDATHQRLAISGATRSENAGNISAGEANAIKSKARAKLGDAKTGAAKAAKAAPKGVKKMKTNPNNGHSNGHNASDPHANTWGKGGWSEHTATKGYADVPTGHAGGKKGMTQDGGTEKY